MQHHVEEQGSNKGKRALRAVTLESDAWLLWLLWLLWLWVLWVFRTRRSTMRLWQRHGSINYASACRVTWEYNSRRPRHPQALDNQPLLAIEGSPKTLHKTGTQRPNGRSAKNAAKCGENPLRRNPRLCRRTDLRHLPQAGHSGTTPRR